ncbi:hypothetical protein EGT74_07660 [Chitinophaga lutea]|uniref:Uncharacterized protein n=1 Tax=Chitinophaga lutea TaxID=2488634 RepID=A0A3N4Q760_9BACT|nr:hypothetical protein [Chitinophaga lutea]RPE13391.1 hypothetical protein EGT74_07660 [Chitinophaga lutea]
MLNKQARNLGLIAIAVSGITIASCSKDDNPTKVYRSKEYTLNSSATGTTASGKVIVQETSDSTFRLIVKLDKSTKDTVYTFAIYKGNKGATAPFDTAISLGKIKSQTTGAALEAKIDRIDSIKINETTKKKFTYDSLLKYDGFARVSFVDLKVPATPKDSIVAIGNIGKNAQ